MPSKASNNVLRLNEMVDLVADYRCDISGATDNSTKINNAIAQNPGRVIYNPRGGVLSIDDTVVLGTSGDDTTLDLGGGYLSQRTNNVDTLVCKPATAGVTAAFANNLTVRNGKIMMSAVPNSTGKGLEIRQCNGFNLERVIFYDADVHQFGGQLSDWNNNRFYASSGSYRGAGSALVHFREAPYGAGLYQPLYTTNVTGFKASASKLRDSIFRIYNADGLFISNGQVASGLNANVLLLGERDGGYISSSSIAGCYLDSGNASTGTQHGVEFRADGGLTNFKIYEFAILGNKIANSPISAIRGRKPEIADILISGNWIGNCAYWGIDMEMGTTGLPNIVGNTFNNNGTNGISGMIRLSGGDTYNLVGNSFKNVLLVCLNASGNWVTGNIVGNTNNSTIADFNNAGATYSDKLYVAGNTSKYAFPGTAFSWVGIKSKFADYANNAAALAGGLVQGQIYQTAGALKVVT